MFEFFDREESIQNMEPLRQTLSHYIATAADEIEEDFSRGWRQLFAGSILDFSKETCNCLSIGCYQAAASLCRTLIENVLCLSAIQKHPQLAPYWEVHALLRFPDAFPPERVAEYCRDRGIDPVVLGDREFRRDYGWAFPVTDNLSLRGIAELTDESIYEDYQYFCDYVHNTSALRKRFGFASDQEIRPLYAAVAAYLIQTVHLCYPDGLGQAVKNAETALTEEIKKHS